jgi:hypothetical protein
MRRRTWLKVGLVGGAALSVAGGAALLLRPAPRDPAHSDSARLVLRAVMPALLAGALPAAAAAREAALAGGLDRSIAAIREFPLAIRLELGELFDLLDSAPGRWLAGVGQWTTAGEAEISAFLQRWRTHPFDLFQVGYQALHDLVLGPWYADPSTWQGIRYPGPLSIRSQ